MRVLLRMQARPSQRPGPCRGARRRLRQGQQRGEPLLSFRHGAPQMPILRRAPRPTAAPPARPPRRAPSATPDGCSSARRPAGRSRPPAHGRTAHDRPPRPAHDNRRGAARRGPRPRPRPAAVRAHTGAESPAAGSARRPLRCSSATTSDLSTSRRSRSSTSSVAIGPPAHTASAASRVKPPAKTASRLNRVCSAALSRL